LNLVSQLRHAYAEILSGKVQGQVEEEFFEPPQTYPPGTDAAELPLGVSDQPRVLPDDRKRKIIRYTPVEDIVVIPVGDLIEISLDEAKAHLSDEAIRRGCPYCYASLEQLLFHVYGHKWPVDPHLLMAKCQQCGRRSRRHAGDFLDDIA
jgi:hypothetical protein